MVISNKIYSDGEGGWIVEGFHADSTAILGSWMNFRFVT